MKIMMAMIVRMMIPFRDMTSHGNKWWISMMNVIKMRITMMLLMMRMITMSMLMINARIKLMTMVVMMDGSHDGSNYHRDDVTT